MTRLISLLLIIVIVNFETQAQDSLTVSHQKRNKLFLHYYPTALIFGDIAVGAEHLFKKRFAHELSINIKTFQIPFYEYDKGFRLGYQLKYNLFNGKIFRFSVNASLLYRDIYYKNKIINYYHAETHRTNLPREPYLTLREDRQIKTHGFGFGGSVNFKLYKKLFIGSDILLNFLKYRFNLHVYEKISGDTQYTVYEGISFPHKFTSNKSTRFSLDPFINLKLSYLLFSK